MIEMDDPIVFENGLMAQELSHVDKARVTDEPQLEHSEIKQSENAPVLSKTDLLKVVIFAWAGSVIVYTSNLYPSGFFVQYLEDNSLNHTLGTISISTGVATTALGPTIISYLPKATRTIIDRTSLHIRCVVYCLVNVICCALVALLDPLLLLDSSGSTGFGILLVIRAIQGFANGQLFVLVQGELVDLYLKENKFVIVLISGSMHVAAIVSSILGTKLYVAGGWVAVGLGIAGFSLLPLLAVPWVAQVEARTNAESALNEEKMGKEEGPELSLLRQITFYLPDLAAVFNNIAYHLLLFVIPARRFRYEGTSLMSTSLILQLLIVTDLSSSILLGYIAGRKLNTFIVMILGSFAFYGGCILAYGSTTEFLKVPYGLEIGAVLVGLGDASLCTLAIMSKFVLYEGWGLTDRNLGKRATTINNITFKLASILGVVASGLTLSRESEVPTIAATAAAFIVGTAGLVLCKIVK